MSFWEDLSPSVRRYVVFAAVVVAALLVFRRCTGPSVSGDGRSTRGVQR